MRSTKPASRAGVAAAGQMSRSHTLLKNESVIAVDWNYFTPKLVPCHRSAGLSHLGAAAVQRTLPIPFSSRQLRRLTQILPTLLQHKLAADRRRRKAHERSNRYGSPARSARTLAQQASEGCYTSYKLGTECSSSTATVPGSQFAGARLLRAILCSTTPTHVDAKSRPPQ